MNNQESKIFMTLENLEFTVAVGLWRGIDDVQPGTFSCDYLEEAARQIGPEILAQLLCDLDLPKDLAATLLCDHEPGQIRLPITVEEYFRVLRLSIYHGFCFASGEEPDRQKLEEHGDWFQEEQHDCVGLINRVNLSQGPYSSWTNFFMDAIGQQMTESIQSSVGLIQKSRPYVTKEMLEAKKPKKGLMERFAEKICPGKKCGEKKQKRHCTNKSLQ